VVVAPKRLELLHELVPAAKVIGLLVDPTDGSNTETTTRDLQAAARGFGVELLILNASTDREVETAFSKVTELRAGGIVIGGSAFYVGRPEQFAALALRHAMPAVYGGREFVAAGGLASYGGNFVDAYRLAGIYAGRVLKGEKPGDLPVQQGTKVELYINLRSAKALGLNVPHTLTGRADEVIE
jgi:putative ABC transport system substrate-binding protein